MNGSSEFLPGTGRGTICKMVEGYAPSCAELGDVCPSVPRFARATSPYRGGTGVSHV